MALCEHHYQAARILAFHAAPSENSDPFGGDPLTWRIEETDEGYRVAGYSASELRELADA